MASAVIKFSAIFMLIAACAADVSELGSAALPVTDVCLGCICQAISGCKLGTGCSGDTCGLFRMTWAYWADSGKPVLPGQSPDQPDAYRNCALDPRCAAQAVQGYMRRFGQRYSNGILVGIPEFNAGRTAGNRDCNGDGQVNCYDYMAIHKRGGYGCVGDLPFDYVNVFNQCIRAVADAQGK